MTKAQIDAELERERSKIANGSWSGMGGLSERTVPKFSRHPSPLKDRAADAIDKVTGNYDSGLSGVFHSPRTKYVKDENTRGFAGYHKQKHRGKSR